MAETKKKKTKPRLSLDKLVSKAVAMADSDGIEKLSMRGLARALNVEAMSLYHHVANKDALVDAMVEHIAAEFYRPDPNGNWREELRNRSMSAHEVLLRHPWAAQATMARINDGPVWLSHVDATIGCLVNAGFNYQMADHAWNALDSHVYGFTLIKLRYPIAETDYQSTAQEYLPLIPRDFLPHLYGMAEAVAEGRHKGGQEFTFALDLILDGLHKALNRAE